MQAYAHSRQKHVQAQKKPMNAGFYSCRCVCGRKSSWDFFLVSSFPSWCLLRCSFEGVSHCHHVLKFKNVWIWSERGEEQHFPKIPEIQKLWIIRWWWGGGDLIRIFPKFCVDFFFTPPLSKVFWKLPPPDPLIWSIVHWDHIVEQK